MNCAPTTPRALRLAPLEFFVTKKKKDKPRMPPLPPVVKRTVAQRLTAVERRLDRLEQQTTTYAHEPVPPKGVAK